MVGFQSEEWLVLILTILWFLLFLLFFITVIWENRFRRRVVPEPAEDIPDITDLEV